MLTVQKEALARFIDTAQAQATLAESHARRASNQLDSIRDMLDDVITEENGGHRVGHADQCKAETEAAIKNGSLTPDA